MKIICISRTGQLKITPTSAIRVPEALPYVANNARVWELFDEESLVLRIINDSEKIQLNPIYIDRILKAVSEIQFIYGEDAVLKLESRSPEVSANLEAAGFKYTTNYV